MSRFLEAIGSVGKELIREVLVVILSYKHEFNHQESSS